MAEQKSDPNDTIQLLLCDSHNVSTQKMIEIQRSKITCQALINLAKKELNLEDSIKVYRENGSELNDPISIKIEDKDAFYISDGQTLEQTFDQCSLCLMGTGGVGKSALTLQFVQGQFINNYDPTIEDAYQKQIVLDGHQIMLDILDTAGQEDFECLRTQWMKEKDGFILVFSLIRKQTLALLNDFYESLCDVYDDNIPPIVLVGNKIDLDKNHIAYIPLTEEEDQSNKNEEKDEYGNVNVRKAPEREISFEEAVAFGKKLGAIYYIETSAKSGYHVQSMIGKMVRHLINVKFNQEQKKKGKKKKKKSSSSANNKKWWTKCTVL